MQITFGCVFLQKRNEQCLERESCYVISILISGEVALMKKITAVLSALLVAWPVVADEVLNWDRMTEEEKSEALKLGQEWKQHQDSKQQAENISEIQQVLNQCGFNSGPIDGAWGKKTAKAATAYVRAHGGAPNTDSRTRLMAQVNSYRVGDAEPCPPAGAVDWERYWSCKGGLFSTGVELELYQKKMTGKGRVLQDGIEINTDYRIEGLSRVWLWGLRDDNIFRYVIQLHENRAAYYDFGTSENKQTTAESEAIYFCE